uniref:Uncharacterized protein n=1 Tax=Lotus japonicus TaxID=34305 RepID=I3SQ58_LOTJA|nr:unknown [Lotus japonicus]
MNFPEQHREFLCSTKLHQLQYPKSYFLSYHHSLEAPFVEFGLHF